MKKRFYYSKQAKGDLRRILGDSVFWFGSMQARRYSHRLEDECRALAGGEVFGRPLTVRGVTYETRLVGAHILICCRDAEGRLRIVRILHSRMDLQRHLANA